MSSESQILKRLIQDLNTIGAIKFGSFKLKSGILSPIYIDLRVTISYPKILKQVSQLMWEKVKNEKDTANFDLICGVPYTALPFATCLSLDHDIPLLMRRKEGPKDYGTKKSLEGVFQKGQQCLVIEDLVTSGGSVLEVVQSLQEEGLVVKDVVVFLDREQGGKDAVEARGMKLHSVLRFSQMLQILEDEKMLDSSTIEAIKKFLEKNQVGAQESVPKPRGLSYARRADLASPVGADLLRLMESKKSNLCVAVDVTSKAELLSIADTIGADICLLKTHVDIVEDFDSELVFRLQQLALKHNFMIFEDRKFADIGNTTKLQYQKGIYHIADWAHFVNAHVVPGPGIIQGLKEVGKPKGRGLILLAEMSSEGSLATGSYTETAVKMAEANKDFVIGFISGKKVSEDPSFIHITPGVQLQTGGDSLGQTYRTPDEAIAGGTDIVVVGRGIYQASNIKQEAERYRAAAWSAYEKRISPE